MKRRQRTCQPPEIGGIPRIANVKIQRDSGGAVNGTCDATYDHELHLGITQRLHGACESDHERRRVIPRGFDAAARRRIAQPGFRARELLRGERPQFFHALSLSPGDADTQCVIAYTT